MDQCDQCVVPQRIGSGADKWNAFAIKRSVQQSFSFSALSLCLADWKHWL